MADDIIQDNMNEGDEVIRKEVEEVNEKEYFGKVKKSNKDYLLKLDLLERERIAAYLTSLYLDEKTHHQEICDKIDEYDDTFRMKRKKIPGTDENSPNYTTPLSTVTLETIHANIMNVFFSPKDIMRVLPTEQGDIPKIKKLDIFGNWSLKNELEIFENCDRLFHSSSKNGECPYIVHWVKTYGVELKYEPLMNPMNPNEPMLDENTGEALYQEREEEKLLYNGPKLEILSRKDYIIPSNSVDGKLPLWEMRRIRMTADEAYRLELQGKHYQGTTQEVFGKTRSIDTEMIDDEGNQIPLGDTEKEVYEFYGRIRINVVKNDINDEEYELEELEDEFIGLFDIASETLISFRKNKFPLKMRPTGMDLFIPDDEGRMSGSGVMEFMESPQKSYDALYNQYIFGVVQANNPFGFFTPMGNQKDEKIKIQNGYLYPTADPSSINIIKLPAPDASMQNILELVRYWAQMLFGIGDYQAGIESTIDPRAPARKAQIVVEQGNVRLNLIIKRKNKTLKDIFKRWFLLYQANMPPNKFMRIAGDSSDTPWQFDRIDLSDFSLNAIPDFELTGNILNSNKTLEFNKKLGIYQLLIGNPFFSPQTREGLNALHALTKWLMDSTEETGLSAFLPKIQGEMVHTPEEENARFLQGDYGEPVQGEQHQQHILVHSTFAKNPTLPEEVRAIVIKHIQATIKQLQEEMTQQMVMAQLQPQGGINVQPNAGRPQPINPPPGLLQVPGMGGPQG